MKNNPSSITKQSPHAEGGKGAWGVGREAVATEYGIVAEHFRGQKLSSLCVDKSGIQTGPFGSQLHKEDYVLDGTPIITVEHLSGNRISHENVPNVSDFDRDRLAKYHLATGDVVFSRVGSVDRNALVGPEEDGWLFSGRCLRVRVDKDRIYPRYLSYFFSLEGFKEYIRSVAVGATMPSINTKILSDVIIYAPPLSEQKAIAHILGSLDDKIELNRRMNATLEGMAQALFKSWFVDFDPVIDNALAAGNPIPDQLAPRAEVRKKARSESSAPSLKEAPEFPATFQFTEELGWIPEGWEVSTINDECQIVGGGTPSTKNPDFWDDGEFHWVTPKDFSALQDKVLLSSNRFLTQAGLDKVSSGLLPKDTVLMSSRAPVGYLAISKIETAINQGFIGMICNKRLSPVFVLQWADSRMDDIKRAAGGSTFAEISKKAFRPFEIVVPCQATLAAYTETVSDIYHKIADGVLVSNTLTKLRDTLLPKLISGEIVIDALEEATNTLQTQ